MIIFKEGFDYYIGYIINGKREVIKHFNSYSEARKELRYLNGGN